MDDEKAYEKAMYLREGEVNRLFDRVNFFLAATAFLIGGISALLGGGMAPQFLPFFYLICTVGALLSIFFFVMNRHNAQIISDIDKYVKELEHNLVETGPMRPFHGVGPLTKIGDLVGSATPGWLTGVGIGPHTWMLPAGFVLVWVVIPWILGSSPPYWLIFVQGLIVGGAAVGFVCGQRRRSHL